MVDYITRFYTFWHTILSCFPGEVLDFFYAVLTLFIVAIFVKLFISWV